MSDAEGRVRRHALNRFYHLDGKWYVEAREGRQGPFSRREEAVAYLEKHKRRHRGKRDDDTLAGAQGESLPR
jgi:hypothetical protein